MADTKLPGLSIAALKDGETIYNRGYGFRDLASGSSTSPDTLYSIGSVTKSFTALGIMQLQEAGKLTLEDPIDSYIPINIHPKGGTIKVKHLLNHSSGIPALAYAEAAFSHITHSSDKWIPVSKTQDLITFMREVEGWAHAKPGERWFYLNEGFILLGSIIEEASGERYARYIDRHILEPIGMLRSFWTKDKAEADPEFATPYNIKGDGERESSSYTYGELLSDGGLISNVTDMSHYLQMYLNGGTIDGRRIIEGESIRDMTTSTLRTPDEPMFGDSINYYGYGLNVRPGFFGHTLISHSGSVWVSTAYIGFVQDERVGVVALANGSGYPLNYIGEYTIVTLMEKNPWNITALKVESRLDELVGTYDAYMGTMRLNVTRRAGLLNVEVVMDHSGWSFIISPGDIMGDRRLFYIQWLDRKIPVEFIKDENEMWLIYERYKLRRVTQI